MTTKYPKEFPIAIKMLDKAQSKLCEPIAFDGDRNWISRCKYGAGLRLHPTAMRRPYSTGGRGRGLGRCRDGQRRILGAARQGH